MYHITSPIEETAYVVSQEDRRYICYLMAVVLLHAVVSAIRIHTFVLTEYAKHAPLIQLHLL